MAESRTEMISKPLFPLNSLLRNWRSLVQVASRNIIAQNILLYAAYVAAALLSVYFNRTFDIAPALVWMPAGIALAGMVLGGYAVTPAIMLGSITTSVFINHSPMPTAVGALLGNTLQPIVGTYLLNRLNYNPTISQSKDIYGIFIVAVLATLTLPGILLSIQWLFGLLAFDAFATTWARVWLGNMLSILILTPLITCWVMKPRIETRWLEIVERGIAFAVLLTLLYFLFWTTNTQIVGVPLIYLLFIPLFWIGLRFTPRWMTLALLLMAISGLVGIAWQASTGALPGSVGQRVYSIQMFMIVMGAIFLILSSVVQERRHATKTLSIHVNQLQGALNRIQMEDEAKSEFLAILAHELRNPLALILSTLEFLKLRVPAEIEEGSMLRNAEDRVHTMSRMLDDLLDMSRITQKSFELQKEPLEVSHGMRPALESVALIMQNRDHNFSVSLPSKPVWLMVDKVRFEQIIVNLLTNAAKYTHPGGTISVRGDLEGEDFVLRVKDNGTGIPSHLIDRIFEPFQQVSEKRLRTAGLGIGLSITKRLVEMHGGTIEATSKGAGQGSEFIVRFPALQQTEESRRTATPKKPASAPPINKAFSLLVVDDNEAAADGMARLLQYKGHFVALAYSGEEAIRATLEKKPEVIILDIGLPDMDGYEVAQYLRKEIESNAILVALTGYGQEEDKQKARNAGFDFHLTKPVSVADIEAILAVIKR